MPKPEQSSFRLSAYTWSRIAAMWRRQDGAMFQGGAAKVEDAISGRKMQHFVTIKGNPDTLSKMAVVLGGSTEYGLLSREIMRATGQLQSKDDGDSPLLRAELARVQREVGDED